MTGRRSCVVHVRPQVHGRAKAYCHSQRVKLKNWVEYLIKRELSIVERRGWPENAPKAYDEPWQRPPFWDELGDDDE
jgi:hypothetical protein